MEAGKAFQILERCGSETKMRSSLLLEKMAMPKTGTLAYHTAQHTLEVCSKWGPKRRTPVAAIGGDLSLPSVVLAMLNSESALVVVADFCEDVISQKEDAERVREETLAAHPLRRRRVGRRRRQFSARQLLLGAGW
ncbi:jg4576 [Pararge aegeria aegeria]|uniref:Jg4576 protein n=1 Tax=Pararge aegeria aegeria TaxID=348720 RepID=A0A8S4RSQ0_9NEOP|nr:jg4576 [Pararge aegeria aegeria]